MPHLYILTGASRGMGLALAQQLLSPSHRLLCLARSINADLAAQAKMCGCTCEQWPQDLADAPAAATRLRAWLRTFDPAACASATLINNAGVISRIGALEDSDDADVSNALRVGLEAPMLLTSAFLDATRYWTAPRKVLNVSSGLGRRAMAGSAAYCAAKAGMDHFTRSVALEQAALPHGARIVSLAPGVIDTDMQAQLRSSDPAGFPDRERFVQLQAQHQLSTPDEAAQRLLAYLSRADFGEAPVADVRDI
jgi:NAD(P)-dependent dehydrogenase (short-subunit alcohol dehydrogenase family)